MVFVLLWLAWSHQGLSMLWSLHWEYINESDRFTDYILILETLQYIKEWSLALKKIQLSASICGLHCKWLGSVDSFMRIDNEVLNCVCSLTPILVCTGRAIWPECCPSQESLGVLFIYSPSTSEIPHSAAVLPDASVSTPGNPPVREVWGICYLHGTVFRNTTTLVLCPKNSDWIGVGRHL